MKNLCVLLGLIAFLSFGADAQAKSRWGINAGATYLVSSGSSGGLALPIAGVHLSSLAPKGVGWSAYLEFQPYKSCSTVLTSVCVTANYISLTPMLDISFSPAFYFGIGPSLKYLTNGSGSSIDVSASAALGFNFTRKVFFETRLDLDISPGAGNSIFDTLYLAFQLGLRF